MILLFTLLVVTHAQVCRFAHNYKQTELLNNATVRDRFVRECVHWETKFIKEVGVDNSTGVTFDGQRVDYATGELMAS